MATRAEAVAVEHVRTVVLDVARPPEVDWTAALLWRVLIMHAGVPVASSWLPSPGRLGRPEAFTRSLLTEARGEAARTEAYRRWRSRMGLPGRLPQRRPAVSLVVCTHRRSAHLQGLLEAVGRLDPAPAEVIVVDNDPGELDSRAVVEAAGARYLREDRRGLDHARTAGAAAASGELVAFTDDDCVPPPGWLAALGALFEDPAVGAVTGPIFAFELATPAQVRFERDGGFVRGLRRRTWDWTSISPLDAGGVGSGANMIFRRSVLEALGDPFPAELDAGTPTESGGDTYVLFRALEAGHRIVYDPGTYVLHRHRRDPASLHRTIRGYGVGLSAVMTKLLLEEHELAAPHSGGWLWRQYRSALLHRLAGAIDPRSQRIAWDYLRGGLAGPAAWVRARRRIPPAPLGRAPSPGPAPELVPLPPAAEPAISVVVPTAGRPGALRRCLAALAGPAPPFEVIVVDDSAAGGAPGDELGALGCRVLRTGGLGAAAARNKGAALARGELLLFLDDDLVARPGLLDAHHARHREEGEGVIVMGYSPPAPVQPGLSEKVAILWWHEHFSLLADTPALTFADAVSCNMSLSRALFERLGGFDEAIGRMRREDWQFGHTALRAGARLVYEPDAVAAHEFSLPTGARLRAAWREGHGDALMAARHADLAVALEPPYVSAAPVARAGLRVLSSVLPRLPRATASALDALEVLKLRGWWRRGFRIAQWSSYAAGRRRGARAAGPPARPSSEPATVVRADATGLLPAPGACAAPFLVEAAGRRPRLVRPELGRWNRLVAEQAAAAEAHALAAAAPSAPGARPLVLLGPAHPAGADRELAVEHLRVRGDPSRHWSVLGEAIADTGVERVLIPLPGVALDAGSVDEIAAGVDGDRVAVVLGRGTGGAPAGPPRLRSRLLHAELVPGANAAFDYVVVHRDRFAELGGFTPGLDALGRHAPPLELAQRALDAGLVVAHQDVSALRPPAPAAERAAQRTRAALLAREGARRAGPVGAAAAVARGVLPLAGDIARRRLGPAAGTARIAAHLEGAARFARRR